MVTVSINLFKKKKGYTVTFTGEQDGKVIHEENMDAIDTLDGKTLVLRQKTIALDKKNITFALKVIDMDALEPKKVKKRAKKTAKKKLKK